MYLVVLLGDEAQVKARFGPFGDSAKLDAERTIVYTERTTDMEIILDSLDGAPR
jgi:hypothetical protein